MSLPEAFIKPGPEKSPPRELQEKLRDLLSSGMRFSEFHKPGGSAGMTHFLDDPESIEYIVWYFGDEGYRDVAERFPGLPVHIDACDEGIVLTIGIRPYKNGLPVDKPREDGLPYHVSSMSFEETRAFMES